MSRPRPPHDPPTQRLPPGPYDPRPASPGRSRRPSRKPGVGVLAAAVVLTACAAVVVLADVLGIDHRTPFVQLIAFRWQLAAGLVVLGALVALLARGLWPIGAGLALVGVVGLLLVAPRVVGGSPASDGTASSREELTVLTLNTYLSQADPDEVADLIAERRPDVVVLPEAGSELRGLITRALADEGDGEGRRSYQATSAERDADVSPMTVLVARDLGRAAVRADRETEFPSLVVDLPDGLRVVATHLQAPKPGDTNAWRRDVDTLTRWCSDVDRPTVVAGDLNATLDHAELREAVQGCSDAATEVGDGLYGTWPAQLPGLLGAQIDHVLLAGGPRARSVEFLEVAGTDHRGVLVRVTRG